MRDRPLAKACEGFIHRVGNGPQRQDRVNQGALVWESACLTRGMVKGGPYFSSGVTDAELGQAHRVMAVVAGIGSLDDIMPQGAPLPVVGQIQVPNRFHHVRPHEAVEAGSGAGQWCKSRRQATPRSPIASAGCRCELPMVDQSTALPELFGTQQREDIRQCRCWASWIKTEQGPVQHLGDCFDRTPLAAARQPAEQGCLGRGNDIAGEPTGKSIKPGLESVKTDWYCFVSRIYRVEEWMIHLLVSIGCLNREQKGPPWVVFPWRPGDVPWQWPRDIMRPDSLPDPADVPLAPPDVRIGTA